MTGMQQGFDQLLSEERGAMFAQRPKMEHCASPDAVCTESGEAAGCYWMPGICRALNAARTAF
ncbi:hypothetical protein ACWGIU_36975, partial [Streptomyces sp. NPDC054840]